MRAGDETAGRQELRTQGRWLEMLRSLQTSVGDQCEGDPSSQIDLPVAARKMSGISEQVRGSETSRCLQSVRAGGFKKKNQFTFHSEAPLR